MGLFSKKKWIATVFDYIQLNKIGLSFVNRRWKNNYIRMVNYHHVNECDRENFRKQLKWCKNNFENVTWEKFESFMKGKYQFQMQPGIIFTFDDGFDDNFDVAFDEMQKQGFTGWYMISPGNIGKTGYMSLKQIERLMDSKEVLGCHTYYHHRMNAKDSEQTLNLEINEAKTKLEELLHKEISIFCWCGGEQEHYTRRAAEKIVEAGFQYSLMTNSYPIVNGTNPFQIQRTNIEASWPISLMRFQLAGFMDLKYRKKRSFVNQLTKGAV